jgi:Arc/MetJ-type ribon-helix-helix transcriptional regulator
VPEKEQDFRGVSLKRELVEEIETFIKEYRQYKSIADFVHEATRVRMEEIRKSYAERPLPRFEQINFDENGVKILDRKLGLVADVYFKPQGAACSLDETDPRCPHIRFALSQPAIQEVIRKRQKEGWKLPYPEA